MSDNHFSWRNKTCITDVDICRGYPATSIQDEENCLQVPLEALKNNNSYFLRLFELAIIQE